MSQRLVAFSSSSFRKVSFFLYPQVQLKEAIEEALEEGKEGRGYVVDCAVAQSELVRPMVNGGTHITEFLLN